MHDLENQRLAQRFHRREVFPCFDDDFSDAHFIGSFERFAQNHVSFCAALFGAEKIGLIEKHRVDLIQLDKFLDIDGLIGSDLDPLEIFFADDDVLPLFVFVTLDDLLPRDFFAIFFSDALVFDGA